MRRTPLADEASLPWAWSGCQVPNAVAGGNRRNDAVCGTAVFVTERAKAIDPGQPASPPAERARAPKEYAEGDRIICVKCGKEGIVLHRGFCQLCEECCDCRPTGT